MRVHALVHHASTDDKEVFKQPGGCNFWVDGRREWHGDWDGLRWLLPILAPINYQPRLLPHAVTGARG